LKGHFVNNYLDSTNVDLTRLVWVAKLYAERQLLNENIKSLDCEKGKGFQRKGFNFCVRGLFLKR